MSTEEKSKFPNGKFIHIRLELLGLILILLLQTFAAIWWASGFSSRTDARLFALENQATAHAAAVEDVHETQSEVLQELARLRQAMETSGCITSRTTTGGGG